MKFSIVTPTLQRESLIRCCQSVDQQTYADWEHLVQVDSSEFNMEIIEQVEGPQRFIAHDRSHHGHYGNHARALACDAAAGDYFVWLDDDNYMADPVALQRIERYLESAHFPDWALFPIHRHGSVFLLQPPGMCMTDSANMVVKREIGRWPDIEAREADGVLAERLKAYPYVAFPQCAPIIVMEKSSNGI